MGLHRFRPGGFVMETTKNWVAHLAGADVYLVAMVGDDPFANTIKSELEKINMNTEYLLSNPDYGSAVYNTIHNYDGDLVAGVADMDVVEQLTPSQASDAIVRIQPKNVVFDGGIAYETIAGITETCSNLGIPGKNINSLYTASYATDLLINEP
ncbi:hypothetical protein AX774_g7655 [Zancudomyces culisetae]|uniref:Uncharacterized protein n=1 Tax=Zancudomyces culisetae TaxID=1213189 RepID=A0A1R1PDE9_ZANCU|nr:hypothetical protein AX774_g7655 [Zancudomyces culisetae]|eukprot:OMH78938.1 hypothetical protein AX774_g7655 [Zancudomyces culisetae]